MPLSRHPYLDVTPELRPIVQLADELISQIAAGEVIERPASVLKELLDNAIDAGATRIDVEIDGSGVERMRVRDNGSGMAARDARMSLVRHATSKIARFEDLSNLTTLGFRGEALASIASVSTLALTTCRAGDNEGVRVRSRGASDVSVEPCSAAPGTSVEVLDLFGNVPARRKFLKSSSTEFGHLTDVVDWLALTHPGVSLQVTRDGKAVREWLRAAGRAERARDVLGVPLTRIASTPGPARIEIFLASPEEAKSGARHLRVIVNGRFVRDIAIAKTVANALGSELTGGKYPTGVVYVDLPPHLVDVNVHPQKAEVRFADPRALLGSIFSLVSRQNVTETGAANALWWSHKKAPPSPTSAELPPAAPAQAPNVTSVTLAVDEAPLSLVAQRRGLLICEASDGLYVVDAHAASERIAMDQRLAQGGTTDAPARQQACAEAHPAGQTLSQEQANALLAALAETSYRAPCLHGHPVVHRIPWNELLRY